MHSGQPARQRLLTDRTDCAAPAGAMPSTAQAHARRLVLDDLPREVLDRITSLLPPRDLASLNATARLFHAAPPGGCSAVERALREHARARSHDRALPTTLPCDVRTWTEELFVRERVLELGSAHASAVSAGNVFSAFVDAEGRLHTCGEQEVPDQSEPESDDEDEDGEPTGEYRAHVATGHSGMLAVRVPTRVASLSAVRVCSVAAGYYHLLVLSEAGAVYGCGYNDHGELGVGHTEEQRSFALVGLPASEPVVCIAAGYAHSLALTAAGCAYSWGANWFGQLGRGDREDRWKPARIKALDGVRVGGIAAGRVHTLLLSTQGAVYSCGSGDYGRLGHGDQQHQHTPRRIEALAGVRAVHVSAGLAHSLVVDSEGAVHSFGFGKFGSLGHGDTRDQLAPRRLDALAGVRIVRACAGGNGSAVLGADGSVHTFGGNEYGQLGLGHGGAAVEAPSRAIALAHARVVHCAMCDCHSLFVSADGSVYACGLQSAALGRGMSEAEQDEPPQRVDTAACIGTAWCARVCC